MFDFAKSNQKVYTHPIPGYADHKPSRLLPYMGVILVVLALVLGAYFFIDFSPAEPQPTPETANSSTSNIPDPADQQAAFPAAIPEPNPTYSTSSELTPSLDISDTNSASPPVVVQPPKPTGPRWVKHKVIPGDSLSSIFSGLELGQSLLIRIQDSAPKEHDLTHIRPGQTFKVRLSADGKMRELHWIKSSLETVIITPAGDSFKFRQESKELETVRRRTSVVIKNSVFVDGQNEGLSDRLIMELTQIFRWDIDFVRSIRPGDQYSLIYETQEYDGKRYKTGDIIAAEFVTQNQRYQAIRYEHKDGTSAYYTPDGKSMRKSFIKTPVDFTRISSRFNPKRLHPITKRVRPHKGIDYAAPMGTPVKAAGDGTIVFNGWKGGYGNVIFIKHANDYSTVYGHLSRFAKGNKVGKKVRQGELIGYVGKTGWATGPHLHYEIRIAGVQKNPLSITEMPRSGIPSRDMKHFKANAKKLLAQLTLMNNTRIALQQGTGSNKRSQVISTN